MKFTFLVLIWIFQEFYCIYCETSSTDPPLSHRISDGNIYLYNLNNDPYEDTNISDDEANQDLLNYFDTRFKYWKTVSSYNPGPDETDRESVWNAHQGVEPWLPSAYEPIYIDQIYKYDQAPNIVFVLIDDWGYNDVGFRSSYLSWTTPTFDKLAKESILLTNYYTYEICTPSRGAFLTGRYPSRYGMTYLGPELPLDETTIAQELKSAGYRNYLIGKWHVGQSSYQHFPNSRGFDYFYGFLGGEIDYYSKENYETYAGRKFLDLRENLDFVRDKDELSKNKHTGYLFQEKVEHAIREHALHHKHEPMFLYYSMQLIHMPWMAPEIYRQRCAIPGQNLGNQSMIDDSWNYCAMNVMMDEALANLTCALNDYGFGDNTLLIISGSYITSQMPASHNNLDFTCRG
jgi:hypothetical protein